MTTNEEDASKTIPAPREINYPAYTSDYRLAMGKVGIGLVATRDIKKGELVFSDSYEYVFTDVQEGDVLRLDRHEKANQRSTSKEENVPAKFPLTRDVLTRTHGVPALFQSDDDNFAGTVRWVLEVPGMLINHSCDPNVIDDSHDHAKGEAYAVRDIPRGQELTYDYTFQYYDHGPFFEICQCGAKTCRGTMMGFRALSDRDKETVLPFASEAVRALHEADVGIGKPVQREQKESPARAPPNDEERVLRLVVPGPSYATASISLRPDEETGQYRIYAAKDFEPGELVYDFWTQPWPQDADGANIPMDMTFSAHLLEGDPPEGDVVRVYPLDCARRDRDGQALFSGWDLLAQHCCDPLLYYNLRNEDEGDDWHSAHAVRAIQKGDLLAVDYNSVLWDRTDWEGLGDGVCRCGASNCRGTTKGFRFLSDGAKEELKHLSCRRCPPPHDGSEKRVLPGEALSPHVRVSWRAAAPGDIGPSDSDSSSSSEDEDED